MGAKRPAGGPAGRLGCLTRATHAAHFAAAGADLAGHPCAHAARAEPAQACERTLEPAQQRRARRAAAAACTAPTPASGQQTGRGESWVPRVSGLGSEAAAAAAAGRANGRTRVHPQCRSEKLQVARTSSKWPRAATERAARAAVAAGMLFGARTVGPTPLAGGVTRVEVPASPDRAHMKRQQWA